MTDVDHETDEQWRMTDRISIPALREELRPKKRPASDTPWPPSLFRSPQDTAVLVAAMVEAVEAQRALDEEAGTTSHEYIRRRNRKIAAFARFDFGEKT